MENSSISYPKDSQEREQVSEINEKKKASKSRPESIAEFIKELFKDPEERHRSGPNSERNRSSKLLELFSMLKSPAEHISESGEILQSNQHKGHDEQRATLTPQDALDRAQATPESTTTESKPTVVPSEASPKSTDTKSINSRIRARLSLLRRRLFGGRAEASRAEIDSETSAFITEFEHTDFTESMTDTPAITTGLEVVQDDSQDIQELAAVSAYGVMKYRKQKGETIKQKKQIKSLSREVEEVKAELQRERAERVRLSGLHTQPVERRNTPQQHQSEAVRPVVENKSADAPQVTRKPKSAPQSNWSARRSASESSSRNGRKTVHERITNNNAYHQSSENLERLLRPATSVKEVIASRPEVKRTDVESIRASDFETTKTRHTPEHLKERSNQHQIGYTAVSKPQTVRESAQQTYEKLKQTATSYRASSRSSDLQSKRRIYASSSPLTVWTAIIVGWGLFFLGMVWLLRNVFGIL